MIKRIFVVMAIVLLLPTMSYAGIAGNYQMDNNFLLKQVKKRWSVKIPKKQLAKMVNGIKKMKATMALSSKGVFKGIASLPGKKEKSIETGTWKKIVKGKVTMVIISIIKKKKKVKSGMKCFLKKSSLFCKGAKSPMFIKFDKKS